MAVNERAPQPVDLAGRLALRPAEAARALGVAERTLRDWMRNEGLPFVRVGGAVLVPTAQLRAWLAQRLEHTEHLNEVVDEVMREISK